MTLNELAVSASSTLDQDELLDRSLEAVIRHLRFDRALILLADEERRVLGKGRSVGGSAEMAAMVAELELSFDLESSQLVQLFEADGPVLFRDVSQDPDERNRALAALLEVDFVPRDAADQQGPGRRRPRGRQPRCPAATSCRATGRSSTRSATSSPRAS